MDLKERILNDKNNFSDFWYKVDDVFQLAGNEGIVTVGYVQGTVTVGTATAMDW